MPRPHLSQTIDPLTQRWGSVSARLGVGKVAEINEYLGGDHDY